MNEEVAKVIIGISTNALNRTFTYMIPADLISSVDIGSVVLAPFGRGNHLKEGYVIEIGNLKEKPEFELKYIHSVKEHVSVMGELLKLGFWIHSRYQCPLTAALKLMLPRDIDVKLKTFKTLILNDNELEKLKAYKLTIADNKKLKKRYEILDFIENVCFNTKDYPYYFIEKDLLARFKTSSNMIKSLEELGLFRRLDETYERKIDILGEQVADKEVRLTEEQEIVIETISKGMDQSEIYLIHGVTGSGKTEVYLRLIEKVLNKGESAIVLIPEIGLTPQTIMRFTSRFGSVIGVMHSRLNLGERYEQWQKAKNGDISIMIGARSAIFTPFEKLGMIIIDEEHEHTYKSERDPKYHAREVAIKRGISHKCPVILGSATPLVDTYQKAQTGQYHLLEMKERAVQGAQKEIEVVDMRLELESGNTDFLSRTLYKEMEEALKRNEQIILFLNRRGYAGSVSCRSCGFVHTCEHCDVSMTYHRNVGRLICHLCGASKPFVKECPACGSKYIKGFGAGTQKIESHLMELFPNARILRMDQDTTSSKHGHEKVLKQFRDRQADILIGTQMVAKGHDFHHVSLVGVLAADMSLNVQDFRGAERTFQLITQVVGRTGRGSIKGRAIIQTYQPKHYSIIHAISEDYKGFFEEEILFRRAMIYPPFCHLLNIVSTSEDEYEGRELLNQCARVIEGAYAEEADRAFAVLGPGKTHIGKIKGKYRNRLIVKGSSYKKLTLVMKELYNRKDRNDNYKEVQLSMEINPMGFN